MFLLICNNHEDQFLSTNRSVLWCIPYSKLSQYEESTKGETEKLKCIIFHNDDKSDIPIYIKSRLLKEIARKSCINQKVQAVTSALTIYVYFMLTNHNIVSLIELQI